MSDKQRIRIEINEDGTINVKTLGIKGEACLQYVEIMERLLDAEAVDSAFTEEYNQTAQTEVEVKSRKWIKGE